MSMPKDEAAAWRECARILARRMTPPERATMTRRVEEAIRTGNSNVLLRDEDVAALFYPNNEAQAAELARQMMDARKRGDVPPIDRRYPERWLIAEMNTWPDCPTVPAESPLRYWLTIQRREEPESVSPENWQRLSDEQEARFQSAGYFTLEQAAERLAAQEGWGESQRSDLLADMTEAAASGALRVRRPDLSMQPGKPSVVRTFCDRVNRADVNEWLAARGWSVRWLRKTPSSVEEAEYRAFLEVALEDDAARLNGLQGDIELSPFPSKYWVLKAQRSGLLAPSQLLMMVGWAVQESGALEPDDAFYRRWLTELAAAVRAGNVRALDPSTLLPCVGDVTGWRWRLSIEDADGFLVERQFTSAKALLAALFDWNFPPADGPVRIKDASRWMKAEFWTLREAAYLLTGNEPETEAVFRARDRDASHPVAVAYAELKNATLAGRIPYIECDGTLDRRRVSRAAAMTWALERGMEVPSELSVAFRPTAEPESEPAPNSGAADETAPGPFTVTRFPKEERQAYRLAEFRKMGGREPKSPGERWQGVKDAAEKMRITRQALTEDLEAALAREREQHRAGGALDPARLGYK